MRTDFHMLRGDARKLLDSDSKMLQSRNKALKTYLTELKSGVPTHFGEGMTLKKFILWLIQQVDKSNDAIKRATKPQSTTGNSTHSEGHSTGSTSPHSTPVSSRKNALPVSGGRKSDKKTK